MIDHDRAVVNFQSSSFDQEKSKMPEMPEMHLVLTVDLAKMPKMHVFLTVDLAKMPKMPEIPDMNVVLTRKSQKCPKCQKCQKCMYF
jgi:hypothetical protein